MAMSPLSAASSLVLAPRLRDASATSAPPDAVASAVAGSPGAAGAGGAVPLDPAVRIDIAASAAQSNPSPVPVQPSPPLDPSEGIGGAASADPSLAMQRNVAYAQQRIFREALASSVLSGQF